MKLNFKILSIFLISIIFCTSILSFSESVHHSLTVFDSNLHFHVSGHDASHHNEPDSDHSGEEQETMISLDQSIIKIDAYSLDINLFETFLPNNLSFYFNSKEYLGKISGVDPPITRFIFYSNYPNPPPLLV
ncbi:hypothetical protein HOG98_09195 [bacterium]|jgi:hypothetical protein|nr:hypothetical protein [bacterium]